MTPCTRQVLSPPGLVSFLPPGMLCDNIAYAADLAGGGMGNPVCAPGGAAVGLKGRAR